MNAHIMLYCPIELARARLVNYLGFSLSRGNLELTVAAYMLRFRVFNGEDRLLASFLTNRDVA